ncbi:BKACE family enzyme [Ancylobacter terrae]|uniref:3-keto-5-aminohexanoate cleavage protein n=1 Tax=Ancylobacter sp. sgz301288 TaxID=3342077 RepID=UPI00385DCE87
MRPPRNKIFITCAVTGNLTTPDQTPHLPITPEQIIDACLGAAEAGAAIVHIHVRDPKTGRPSMDIDYYREVVETLRARRPDLILNLTTGPGGRFVPSPDEPRVAGPGTTLMVPEKRVEHIAILKPDISTLDLNTMNSGAEVVINTPANVRRMAKVIREAGVKPELELFDSGDIALMSAMIADGSLEPSPLCTVILGVRYGFQPSPETVLYARNLLPPGTEFTALGIGRTIFATAAQSYLAGGHVRVGLEDSVYLGKGELAPSNAAMVEKARLIVEQLGGQIMNAREARELLRLPEASGAARAA